MRTAARLRTIPTVALPRPGARALLLLVLFGVVVFLTAYPTLFMFVSSFETNRPGQAVTWGLDAWRTAFVDPSLFAAPRHSGGGRARVYQGHPVLRDRDGAGHPRWHLRVLHQDLGLYPLGAAAV